MNLLSLAWKSLRNRRGTALLTLVAIAVSVALLLGVEKVRVNARASFANTVSGTDLIVGARSGSVQLLLYSVFRIGNATNNISWETYQEIKSWRGISWTIPISLGDSHRGYRVLGTNRDYFEYFRYADKRPLQMASGKPFADTLEAVIGFDVAEALGYRLGQKIIVAHGVDAIGNSDHDESPFTVVGILERTGTPVDRTVHVSLEGIEAMHLDWNKSGEVFSDRRSGDLTPVSITAFFVGLENRMAAFSLQRKINEFQNEPLLAIFPGVALFELWDLMRVGETALLVVSVLVVAAALVGLLAVSLAGLNERRREMAILRSVGAGYRHIIALLVIESTLLTALGIVLGLVILTLAIVGTQPLLISEFGLYLPLSWPDSGEMTMLGLIMVAGTLVGFIPAYFGYRNSLADGLSVRL